jgi:hypothetical protein
MCFSDLRVGDFVLVQSSMQEEPGSSKLVTRHFKGQTVTMQQLAACAATNTVGSAMQVAQASSAATLRRHHFPSCAAIKQAATLCTRHFVMLSATDSSAAAKRACSGKAAQPIRVLTCFVPQLLLPSSHLLLTPCL